MKVLSFFQIKKAIIPIIAKVTSCCLENDGLHHVFIPVKIPTAQNTPYLALQISALTICLNRWLSSLQHFLFFVFVFTLGRTVIAVVGQLFAFLQRNNDDGLVQSLVKLVFVFSSLVQSFSKAVWFCNASGALWAEIKQNRIIINPSIAHVMLDVKLLLRN